MFCDVSNRVAKYRSKNCVSDQNWTLSDLGELHDVFLPFPKGHGKSDALVHLLVTNLLSLDWIEPFNSLDDLRNEVITHFGYLSPLTTLE